MIVGSVRKISLVALLVATAALLVPGAAQAAPTVYCVIAYGHENPGNCNPQPDLNAAPYQGRIYPTSQPYGYGEKGLLFVEGNATPGSSMTVSATDGSSTVTRRVETALSNDPQFGRRAGDFKADLKVTNLGVHAGSPTNPNGISTLTVTVSFTSAPDVSKTTTIAKYAIAPGDQGPTGKDKYAPQFPSLLRPDGTNNPPNPPNPETPKTFWFQESLLLCDDYDCNGQGEAKIRGLVEDDTAGAFGHASEIASITVTITQDGVMIRNYGNVADRINSTQARFDITVKIGDLEPNFPLNAPYTVTIRVEDANGNKTGAAADFNVMPV